MRRGPTAGTARSLGTALTATALTAVLAASGCASGRPDPLAVRVNPLPPGVRAPGAAVFLARVPDERRSDLLGLIRVGGFGDALANGTLVVALRPARARPRLRALGMRSS
ncbi:hypothetical protein [Sphaerisporangium fuscum]|uniref:hypothetical protein n=1 Tax=Sphaerisporangium fuscum TaxID=2835868 RepID=UPI001BDC6E2D|nr:hypothetical protein [Sphaerisporangium fuscum]